jgi:hypothetical protein
MAQAERLIWTLVELNMEYSPRSAIPKLPAIASFMVNLPLNLIAPRCTVLPNRTATVQHRTTVQATPMACTYGNASSARLDLKAPAVGYGQHAPLLPEDSVPEVSAERPVTKRGDLWLLGAHRLYCGDARDEQVGSSASILIATSEEPVETS